MRIDKAINFRDDIMRIINSNPDIMGEVYRKLIFKADASGELGCYSTFDVNPRWIKADIDLLSLEDRVLLLGCDAKDESELARISVYKDVNSDTLTAWHWDGDGTLMIKEEGGDIYINTDCKKTYGWEKNPTWQKDLPEDYFE